MYTSRKYEEKDAELILDKDLILGLQIQYDGDFHRDHAVVVYDDNGNLRAVGALGYDSSWYWPDNKSAHFVSLNYYIDEDDREKVFACMMNELYPIFEQIKENNKDKVIGLLNFQESDEIKMTQMLLKYGFTYSTIIPVLGYDLTQNIPDAILPDHVVIKEVPDDQIEAYIAATGQANEGCKDSINEYYFRKGDESFTSFAAYVDENIVGGISIWNIGEERGATENIFVVPSERRKGIAQSLIAYAFEQLKSRGLHKATLSMLGDNEKAMRLYQKIGYELMYYLVRLEMR